ncbi:MAG: cytochrome c oxidase assembly protein [Candidatus Porifericomitaceae bacterium WSBS_2022_MAG_OTU9]
MESEQLKKANARTAGKLALVALLMVGFGYALVPIYNVFCDLTGLNGKVDVDGPVSVEGDIDAASDRWVTVTFDGSVQSELPWTFRPTVTSREIRVGSVNEAYYSARNTADYEVTGRAIPSIAPGAASKHFRKMECFCFSQQTLAAGEERSMPLRFVISPELPEDIGSLTLSYTFFNSSQDRVSNVLGSGDQEEG